MTRSNIYVLRELRKTYSDEESELSIMTKSQELSVTKIMNNSLSTFEDNIIFYSDEENSIDELNEAVIYGCQDKVINDIKKWNRLRKLNKKEPIIYCITQLEHVLSNVSNILERINNENF